MIECPSCREKIRISDEICPFCDFDVKGYYEDKLGNLHNDFVLKKIYTYIEPPSLPQKRVSLNSKIFAFVALMIISFIIVIGAITDTKSIQEYWFFIVLIVSVPFLMFVSSYKSDVSKYNDTLDEYNFYQYNAELYKIIKADENHKNNMQLRKPSKPIVTCPYCKSTDVKRITTAGRVTGVIMLGLASSNIGKQWYCNNCKSKF